MVKRVDNLRRGFTLLELLVVISIISLLLAILIPSLQRARKQAKSAMCQMNLRQWGYTFSIYATENNGRFLEGWWAGNTGKSSMWQDVFRPFYSNQGKLRVCPEATIPTNPTANPAASSFGSTTKAWGVFGEWWGWTTKGDYGSYGINGWVYNAPDKNPKHWRTINVKGAANAPAFLDSVWVATWPDQYYDRPPQLEDEIINTGSEMARHCINRHSGYINSVMLDCSVQRIGLKQLWRVKWHRQFDVNARHSWTTWPEWMKKFKDYD